MATELGLKLPRCSSVQEYLGSRNLFGVAAPIVSDLSCAMPFDRFEGRWDASSGDGLMTSTTSSSRGHCTGAYVAGDDR